MNKLYETISIFYFLMDKLQNLPISEVKEHIILDPFPDNKEPSLEDPYNPDNFPKIE